MIAATGKTVNYSRLFTYFMTRKLENRIGQKGASLATTFESMKQYGVVPHVAWPFHRDLVEKHPTNSVLNLSINDRLRSYDSVDINKFKEYIVSGMPIIIGMNTGRNFWKLKGPITDTCYYPINDTDNRQYKGHALIVVGYNDNLHNGSWIIANSLGLTWGDHSIAAMSYTCSVDIMESYAITDFNGIIPERKID
jgi:C1A family cysteine protease